MTLFCSAFNTESGTTSAALMTEVIFLTSQQKSMSTEQQTVASIIQWTQIHLCFKSTQSNLNPDSEILTGVQ